MLSYRTFEDGDLAGILELWEASSGWGGISERQFREWYIDTPNGPCLTILATNETGRIVGQKVFIPREIYLNGHRQMALRAVAPILADEARLPNMLDARHPILAMFKCGVQEAKNRGYSVIYTFPAAGWSVWMKAFYRFKLPAWELSTYPCFQVKIEQLPRYIDDVHSQLSLREVDQLTDELDDESPAIAFNEEQTGFVKSAAWLNWKYANDRIFCFYREKKMAGYLVLKAGTHLILDANARTPALFKSLFTFLLNQLKDQSGPQPVPVLSGMLTPFWEALLSDIAYTLIDYSFVFGRYALNENPDQPTFQTESWNIFPGD